MPGRIPDEDVQQLRERSDLVELISGYTQLKRAGRIFKGHCCFHQEKTPSFTVDPAKQLYHCFGCGAGGDVFIFLREVEGLSFSEAAERLADRLGMALRREGSGDSSTDSRRALLASSRAAAELYAQLLLESPEAGSARTYLERRGFTIEDARSWGVGYAPGGRDAMYRRLIGRRFTSKQIVEAGLALVTGEGQHRDRFRARLVFPIADVAGQVVGFGARALGDEQPKYLNSPETPIYRKARILYGLDRAKTEMARSGLAVLTEGYTDVIALHRAGVTNAVATCGTALGEEHFALIKRFCDRAVLAFDADAAGALASERGFGIHAHVGLEVLVASLPSGKDPADVALTEGSGAVRSILDQAVPLMRFVLEAEIRRHRLDTPEGKARAVRSAASLLAAEASPVARSEHGFWLARRIGVDPQQVVMEIAEAREVKGRGEPHRTALRIPGHVKLERQVLSLLMDSPGHLANDAAGLCDEHFTEPQHRVLLRAIREAVRDGQSRSIMDLVPDDSSRRLAAELALAPAIMTDPQEVFLRLEEFRLRRQIDILRSKLDQLDPADDVASYDALFQEIVGLEEHRRRFGG